MKNFVLYASLLAGIVFVACGDDEESVPLPSYVGCAICEIPETAPSEIEEQPYEVCIDTAGIAYVDNAYTGIEANYYFQLYCANEIEEQPLPPSGFDDDAVGQCRTCEEYEIAGMAQPAKEICKSATNTAIVDGVDSGTPYSQYMVGMEVLTDCE